MSEFLEQLNHVTVKITCEDAKGNKYSGTGYIFAFLEEESANIPAIVTNKHVVNNMEKGYFHLTLKDADGSPDIGNHDVLTLNNLQRFCLYHPIENVDLAIIPIGYVLNEARNNGKEYYFTQLNRQIIPNRELLDSLFTVEDVLMVGYPNGVWDESHNLPVFRKGITATHAGLKWNDRPEFLIDVACFHGSSGSPVFLFNNGGYSRKGGRIAIGSRISFLGTLWGAPVAKATGEIRVIEAPTSTKSMAYSDIPTNLGFVIHSSELLVFDELIKDFIDGIDINSVIKNKNSIPNVSRNSLCSCGSGLKYKSCHGKIK